MHNVTCVRLVCWRFDRVEFVGSFPTPSQATLAALRHATAAGLPVPASPPDADPDGELYRADRDDGVSHLYHVVDLGGRAEGAM